MTTTVRRLAAWPLIGLCVAACEQGTGPIWVDDLNLRPDSAFLDPGESIVFSAVPLDQRGRELPERAERVTWSISNPSLAALGQTLGSEASVSGVTVGTTSLRVSLGRGTRTGLIYIEPAGVSRVEIDPSPIEVTVGQGKAVRARIYDADGNLMATAPFRISWDIGSQDVARMGTGRGVQPGPSTGVTGRVVGGTTVFLQVGDRKVTAPVIVR